MISYLKIKHNTLKNNSPQLYKDLDLLNKIIKISIVNNFNLFKINLQKNYKIHKIIIIPLKV